VSLFSCYSSAALNLKCIFFLVLVTFSLLTPAGFDGDGGATAPAAATLTHTFLLILVTLSLLIPAAIDGGVGATNPAAASLTCKFILTLVPFSLPRFLFLTVNSLVLLI
jgi:hypothetical protein